MSRLGHCPITRSAVRTPQGQGSCEEIGLACIRPRIASVGRAFLVFGICALELLGGDKVHCSVKFVSRPGCPSPPAPLPWGEGGRRTGEGSVANRTALLGGLRLLATDARQPTSSQNSHVVCLAQSRRSAEVIPEAH